MREYISHDRRFFFFFSLLFELKDLVALVIQAAGGGLASSAKTISEQNVVSP
jgi:hypothetical protein